VSTAVRAVVCIALFAGCSSVQRTRAEVVVPPVFLQHCSSCHGEKGRGDGPAGRFLKPAPRDFGDVEWQRSITDERLRQTIRLGGAALGLSPIMAAHPDLSPAQVQELIDYIRSIPDA
jgi:mono/diheme cytochrome c family protein